MKQAAIKNKVSGGVKPFYNSLIPSDWTVFELGDIGDFKNGINKDKEEFGHGYPLVGLMDVFGIPKIYNSEFSLVNTTDNERRDFDLKKGDVLFVRSSVKPEGVGLTTLVCQDMPDVTFSGFLIRFRETGHLDFEFKAHCFYEENFRQRLLNKSTISANTNINQVALKSLKIAVPPISEQKSIAQMLSTSDAAIHTTEKLIAQKELRKKWLMQQLLTGKKRLKGFKGEWKFVRFKEIYSQVKQKAGNDKHLVLSVTKDGIVSQAEYFNKEIASEDTSPYLVVRKGDMVMSGLNFWMGSIDVLSEYESGMVSPAYKVFEIHNPEISAEFMKTFVRSEIMLQCLLGSSVVGASIVRRNLDRETLDEWSFKIPSLKEQTAIAQVLQAADKEISLLKLKAEKLREKKKGLMQKLLTGKIRIK